MATAQSGSSDNSRGKSNAGMQSSTGSDSTSKQDSSGLSAGARDSGSSTGESAKGDGSKSSSSDNSSARQGSQGGSMQSSQQDGEQGTSKIAQFDSVKDSLATQITEVSDKIRAFTPKSGTLGRYGETVVGGLTNVSGYLQGRSTADLGGEILSIVKRNPVRVAASVAGAGLGFILAQRWEKRRSTTKTSGSQASAGRSSQSTKSSSSETSSEPSDELLGATAAQSGGKNKGSTHSPNARH